jgi:UPF0716 protein FxsA
VAGRAGLARIATPMGQKPVGDSFRNLLTHGVSMMRRLLPVLLIVFPLVELALLLWLAQQTSWELVLAWVIGTALVGLGLIRHTGVRCAWEARRRMAQGESLGDHLVNCLLLLIAGVLLVLPGVITDLTGLILWLPPVRRAVRQWFYRSLQTRLFPNAPADQNARPKDCIIDVRVIGKDPPRVP